MFNRIADVFAAMVWLLVIIVLTSASFVLYDLHEYITGETQFRQEMRDALSRPAPPLTRFYKSGHAAGSEKDGKQVPKARNAQDSTGR